MKVRIIKKATTTLKYTIIKDSEQYYSYCDILEELILQDEEKYSDDIELLHLLIEKWDRGFDRIILISSRPPHHWTNIIEL